MIVLVYACNPRAQTEKERLLKIPRPARASKEEHVLKITQIHIHTNTNNNKKQTHCYMPNACVSPKFLCWNPNPQIDGIRRWKKLSHETKLS